MKTEYLISKCPETGLSRKMQLMSVSLVPSKQTIVPLVQITRYDSAGQPDRVSGVSALHSKISMLPAVQPTKPVQPTEEQTASVKEAQAWFSELSKDGFITDKTYKEIEAKVKLWYGSSN